MDLFEYLLVAGQFSSLDIGLDADTANCQQRQLLNGGGPLGLCSFGLFAAASAHRHTRDHSRGRSLHLAVDSQCQSELAWLSRATGWNIVGDLASSYCWLGDRIRVMAAGAAGRMFGLVSTIEPMDDKLVPI